jgi:selenocysteine-specific elongation factor
VIVGTAGHIDHGKTTLVKALTGVDTDRLPEEKKRGISIELGYAFMNTASGKRIGFVDVPGHERLVHTMLAGATGIDYALLLVAADDGVMPQTREHLAVLSLLGLAQGAVIMTKADRVDAARIVALSAELRQLLQGTSLQAAPVLAVSAATGQGMTELHALLDAAALQTSAHSRHPQAQDFRLAVDRVFTLDGVGTVATGTVHSGSVAIGDALACVPQPHAGTAPHARVRSLRAHGQPVQRATVGDRCALGLAGISHEAIARGQWFVSPAIALQTQRLDASITLWHDEPRPLRSGTVVQVHVGAAHCQGTVALLSEGESLAPSGTACVQLVLHAPMAAWRGDRVVLRDACASRTLAGGVVLDPFAPARYRRTPQRMAELQAMSMSDAPDRQNTLLNLAPYGINLHRLAVACGEIPLGDVGLSHEGWALGEAHAAAALLATLGALQRFHAQHEFEAGLGASRLRRLAVPRMPEPLWRMLIARWLAAGELVRTGAFIHLAEHGIKLSAVDQRIGQAVAVLLDEAGYEGAWVRDLAAATREPEALMRTTLARLAQRGELHQIVKDLFYPHATVCRLAAIARQVAAAQGDATVTAAAFRDATKLGRKRAIQILEYFDRVGLLRRAGDTHKLRCDSELFAEGVTRVAT